jgi:D,D-heptose 1,7-bisphosphate phosphatase
MEAIILAGGLGTRLRSVVSDVPKPMAPVNGEPFLNYILDELNYYNFNHVILCVGYKKEVIMDYYKDSYKNIKISYSIEEESLGTGGAIKKAMSLALDDMVFVLNGDTIFKVDFNKIKESNKISIACKYMEDFDRYGEVKIKDSIIQSFEEKCHVDKGYINGGIYYLPKNIFDKFELPHKFSLEADFFTPYMKELGITAYMTNSYFLDIGIPSDYSKAQDDFKKKKALFLDRDGIINIDYGHVHTIDKFKFTPFIFDLAKKYYDLGYLIIVITNQAGVAKGLYPIEDVYTINSYMMQEFKKHGIEISSIYFCPHKDSDNCRCRKPMPGMYLDAIHDFNIDPVKSIAIGDKTSDLIAANKAGVGKLYFVKTEYEEEKVDFEYERLEF